MPEIASLMAQKNQNYIFDVTDRAFKEMAERVEKMESKTMFDYKNIADCMQDRIDLQADIKLIIMERDKKIENKILTDISSLYPDSTLGGY